MKDPITWVEETSTIYPRIFNAILWAAFLVIVFIILFVVLGFLWMVLRGVFGETPIPSARAYCQDIATETRMVGKVATTRFNAQRFDDCMTR